MRLKKFLNRTLGRPGGFDVDAVRSVLEGRSQPTRTDSFRGFNSPPVDIPVKREEPPSPEKQPGTEKRGAKKKRKRTEAPASDRF